MHPTIERPKAQRSSVAAPRSAAKLTPPPPKPVLAPAQRAISPAPMAALQDEEYVVPDSELLMSTTGRITHCNAAFMHVSGFSMDELMSQPHNIVRHPDMPAEAFQDLWATIGHGRAWSGVVKNRRKDGSYYWVRAYVTPIVDKGKPIGYMSVRVKPSDGEVRAASALYQKFQAGTQDNARLAEESAHSAQDMDTNACICAARWKCSARSAPSHPRVPCKKVPADALAKP